MVLFYLFFVIFCLRRVYGDDISLYCAGDIKKLCSDDVSIRELPCLYQHQSTLSESCANYIKTAPGACNYDALMFCSQYLKVDDITRCLEDHKDELSSDCAVNLSKKDDTTSPAKAIMESNKHNTKVVTTITVIYLLVPLLLCLWALYMVYSLHKEQLDIINSVTYNNFTDMVTENEDTNPLLNDHLSIHGQNNESTCRNNDILELQGCSSSSWQIGYYNLSYWVASNYNNNDNNISNDIDSRPAWLRLVTVSSPSRPTVVSTTKHQILKQV